MSDDVTAPQADTGALAEEVYDVLMAEIEPELLLTNIPTLDQKYANETPAEHDARMLRYAEAYKRFDAELNNFMTDVNGNLRAGQRDALKAQEQQSQTEEQAALSSLDSAFAASPADKSAFASDTPVTQAA